MWNLKYDTNEHTYKTDSDIENRLVVVKGWGRGVGKGKTGSLGLVDAN